MIKHSITCDGCGIVEELVMRQSVPGEHDAHVRGEALRPRAGWRKLLNYDLCEKCVYRVIEFIKRIHA